MSLDMMYQPYASYFSPYQRSAAPVAAATTSSSASPDPYQHKGFVHSSPGLPNRLTQESSLFEHSSSSHTSSFPFVTPRGSSSSTVVHPAALGAPPPPDAPTSLPGNSATALTSNASSSMLGLNSLKTETDAEDPCDAPSGPPEFLRNNCYLFSYFEGIDSAAKVDEHFTRSLNQSNSYNSKDTPTPMTSRNLPASFWDIHYTPPSAPVAPSFGHDPHSLAASSFSLGADAMTGYMSGHVTSGMSSLHGMSSLQDPWRAAYPMTSQSSAAAHHHHSAYAAHSLNAYSPPSRYGSHYSSLLPSAAAAGLNSWNSRYGFNATSPAAYGGI